MPAGLQVFDASGNLQLEISDRVYRLLTFVDIPTTNSGSQAIAGLDGGSAVIGAVTVNTSRRGPTLGISGGSLTWNYGSIPSGERDTSLRVFVAVF